MKHKTTHGENLNALRRIEGQIKGIQRMVEQGKYCIDIINQVLATSNALHSVAEKILAKHIQHCVRQALIGKSKKGVDKKIDELMTVIGRFRRLS